MKKMKIFFLLLMASSLSIHLYAQDSGKEQLVVPLSDPGKAFKINVGLVNGSITIAGYDGKDIQIDAETPGNKSRTEEDKGNTGGMRKLSSHSLSVTAQERNNNITIGTDKPNLRIHLYIKIPKGASDIKAETVNDGDIEISNTGGEMEITNVNGSIRLKNVSGSVVTNTVNGDVIATFNSIDVKAAMAFSTLNGHVDVTFPSSLKANMRLRSERGGVYTDFEIAVDKSEPVVEKTKEGNMYRVSLKDWVNGKIGGGGPEIMMNTMNGNVYVRKLKQ
jgi:hypothetical protein